jgi:DNA-binding IclR family transcriptional regulator
MSTVEKGGSLRSEFMEKLSERDNAVSINYLLKETSAENRREAKQILRTMIDEGMISTTPGFKYRLASDVSATA